MISLSISKILIIRSLELEEKYNTTKLIKIFKKHFDSSNPAFTQTYNPKKFQIKLNTNKFIIRKIDKVQGDIDPTFMFLTLIIGYIKTEEEHTNINLEARIELSWTIILFILFFSGIFFGLFYDINLLYLIPLTSIFYIYLRHCAKLDFDKFVQYFQFLINECKE